LVAEVTPEFEKFTYEWSSHIGDLIINLLMTLIGLPLAVDKLYVSIAAALSDYHAEIIRRLERRAICTDIIHWNCTRQSSSWYWSGRYGINAREVVAQNWGQQYPKFRETYEYIQKKVAAKKIQK